MTKVAANLPGYATVRHVADVLHLAPRSVRDLIYAGRLPSVRLGWRHFVRAADLEVERRRRLGLHPVQRASRASRPPRASRAHSSAAATLSRRTASEAELAEPALGRQHLAAERETLRRQRAAERGAMVSHWAARHHAAAPPVPFVPTLAEAPATCASCSHAIRTGRRMVAALPDNAALCLPCGRRALLDWADRRRLEAAAARRMAQDLSVAVLPAGEHARRVAA